MQICIHKHKYTHVPANGHTHEVRTPRTEGLLQSLAHCVAPAHTWYLYSFSILLSHQHFFTGRALHLATACSYNIGRCCTCENFSTDTDCMHKQTAFYQPRFVFALACSGALASYAHTTVCYLLQHKTHVINSTLIPCRPWQPPQMGLPATVRTALC